MAAVQRPCLTATCVLPLIALPQASAAQANVLHAKATHRPTCGSGSHVRRDSKACTTSDTSARTGRKSRGTGETAGRHKARAHTKTKSKTKTKTKGHRHKRTSAGNSPAKVGGHTTGESEGAPPVPATCQDGARPVPESEGVFVCADGSEPICEDGLETTVSHDGLTLLCEAEPSEEGEDGSGGEEGAAEGHTGAGETEYDSSN
jgi:hypothetical protein